MNFFAIQFTYKNKTIYWNSVANFPLWYDDVPELFTTFDEANKIVSRMLTPIENNIASYELQAISKLFNLEQFKNGKLEIIELSVSDTKFKKNTKFN